LERGHLGQPTKRTGETDVVGCEKGRPKRRKVTTNGKLETDFRKIFLEGKSEGKVCFCIDGNWDINTDKTPRTVPGGGVSTFQQERRV